MTSSNRLGNRVLLALIGLAAVGAGAWMVFRAYPWLLPISLPDIPAPDATALWLTAVSVSVGVILALLWIFSRGRGRSGRLLHDTSTDGSVEFDVSVAVELLTAALARQPDIRSVKVVGYRARRACALFVTVDARTGCDLPRLRDDVGDAVESLDHLLERRMPVVLHVASGVRAAREREQRVT